MLAFCLATCAGRDNRPSPIQKAAAYVASPFFALQRAWGGTTGLNTVIGGTPEGLPWRSLLGNGPSLVLRLSGQYESYRRNAQCSARGPQSAPEERPPFCARGPERERRTPPVPCPCPLILDVGFCSPGPHLASAHLALAHLAVAHFAFLPLVVFLGWSALTGPSLRWPSLP